MLWGKIHRKTKDTYENKRLLQELNDLKNKTEKERYELNDYFLTWVHQIKTPITVLKLMFDNDSKDVLQMKNELVHIENYTNNALNFVKLIDSERNMNFTKVNINDVIFPIIRSYSTLFINNNIKLTYNLPEYQVISDFTWLSVLLEQLISNATKYAKDKDVRISFYPSDSIDSEFTSKINQSKKGIVIDNSMGIEELNSLLLGGNYSKSVLVIEDTGIGIKSEDLPKVFDKGYSAFNGRLSQKSTGVGLFIVKKVAYKLGIDIAVQSEYGQGTTIFLYIPSNENYTAK
ncbi:HAMP domain-containing histidine kinase [Actinomyces sp. zg-332]|uniref:sensor histidine kinase n=1 Tax=Actinomyces sp. zg-332 TaxID=2708340 RepID=UPI00141FB9F3|nr:HAMP domain-containing sensor histidine kinase [Actinomyces sp. zg-332]QPK94064.1 HAMP domain-containing histidine kinase [Actinomyces sp. zg-332]